jgi:hypothetical protein
VMQQYPVTGEDTTVGREDADIAFPDDAFMSPLHAQLTVMDDKITVRDLGSRNGTWYFLTEPHRLIDGDLLLIGSQMIRFRRLGYPGPHPPERDATRRMGSLIPNAMSASSRPTVVSSPVTGYCCITLPASSSSDSTICPAPVCMLAAGRPHAAQNLARWISGVPQWGQRDPRPATTRRWPQCGQNGSPGATTPRQLGHVAGDGSALGAPVTGLGLLHRARRSTSDARSRSRPRPHGAQRVYGPEKLLRRRRGCAIYTSP